MYQGHAPLGIIQFWSLFWNAFFPESLEKGNAASECGKLNVENRFCGLQMVQFECTQVIHPLVLFYFGVLFLSALPHMQEKGNAACICQKVVIYFAKIGFVNCKCSDLNTPGSYTIKCHSHLGTILVCIFPACRERALFIVPLK